MLYFLFKQNQHSQGYYYITKIHRLSNWVNSFSLSSLTMSPRLKNSCVYILLSFFIFNLYNHAVGISDSFSSTSITTNNHFYTQICVKYNLIIFLFYFCINIDLVKETWVYRISMLANVARYRRETKFFSSFFLSFFPLKQYEREKIYIKGKY